MTGGRNTNGIRHLQLHCQNVGLHVYTGFDLIAMRNPHSKINKKLHNNRNETQIKVTTIVSNV